VRARNVKEGGEQDHDRIFWGKAEIGNAEIRQSGFLFSARAKGAQRWSCSILPISVFQAFGAGIPHPASNPSILYQLSMLYGFLAARLLFSADFGHFGPFLMKINLSDFP